MNYQNLQILTDFFESVHVDHSNPVYCPDGEPTVGFDMVRFTDSFMTPAEVCAAPCGTSCCFIGHGPMAGLAPDPESIATYDWAVYSYEVMGLDSTSDECNKIWSWLFDTNWPSLPHMAVRRARYILGRHPIPSYEDIKKAQKDNSFLHYILKEVGV